MSRGKERGKAIGALLPRLTLARPLPCPSGGLQALLSAHPVPRKGFGLGWESPCLESGMDTDHPPSISPASMKPHLKLDSSRTEESGGSFIHSFIQTLPGAGQILEIQK